MSRIIELNARLLTARLPRPWGDAVLENHLLPVDVHDDLGNVGHGFSWTPTIGPHAVLALLQHDIRDWAVGQDASPESVWDRLWAHLHEAGSGGITTIAMAGLDLALWDLDARRRATSVPRLIGIHHSDIAVYGSGVNRHLSLDQLLLQVQRWVEAGHTSVKIKVGGRALSDDLERVRAVRDALGDDRELMLDANQLWDLDEAVQASHALEPFGVRWLEEPLRADDLAGYRALAASTPIPLAAGENLYTRHRFAEFFEAGALAVAQPNVVRVGGITPFLRIARDAAARGVEVYPHLLPDLSGQLAACLGGPALIEDVEDSSLAALGVLAAASPVEIEGPRARLVDQPGLGIILKEKA